MKEVGIIRIKKLFVGEIKLLVDFRGERSVENPFVVDCDRHGWRGVRKVGKKSGQDFFSKKKKKVFPPFFVCLFFVLTCNVAYPCLLTYYKERANLLCISCNPPPPLPIVSLYFEFAITHGRIHSRPNHVDFQKHIFLSPLHFNYIPHDSLAS